MGHALGAGPVAATLSAVLAAAGAPAASAQGLGEATIRVTATPSRLVLGEDKGGRVELVLPGPRDPKAPVRVVSSVGRVGELSDGGLQLVGAFSPPDTFFPQVAIVAATTRIGGRPVVGWLTIPLLGMGSLSVKTPAGSAVSVKVGQETFGPVRADRTGKAAVPVKVMPGFTEAHVVGTGRAIPLGAASFKRVLAVALDEAVPADGSSATHILAFVVDKFGKPDPTARVFYKAERGETGPISTPQPGVYASAYISPASVGPGGDAVTVGLVGDEGSRDVTRVRLVQGSAKNLSVSLDPPAYSPGSQPPFVLVSVRDASGNPASATVDLSAEVGKFGPTRVLSTGRYAAPFQPPDNFGGKSDVKIVVVAKTAAGAQAREEKGLLLTPGKPTRLEVTAGDNARVPADGSTVLSLGVKVVDAWGNAIPGAPITASADDGVVRSPEPAADGGYSVSYVPPLAFEKREVKVSLQGPGGLSTEVPLGLAPAQRAMSLGVRAGFVSNLVALHAPYAGLELAFRLRTANPQLLGAIEGGVTYGSTSNGDVNASLLTVPVALSLRLQFAALSTGVLAYLGIGPVVDFVVARADPPPVGETLLVLGGQAHLGVGYQFGRSSLALEVRYVYASARGAVVSGAAGEAQQVGGLAGTLRYQFDL